MRILALAMFVLVALPLVTAIGVRPPIVGISYEPGRTVEFTVSVLNLNDFPVELESRTAMVGDVNVKLPKSIPARGAADIKVTYTMPAQLEPGMTSGYIFFKEKFVDENTATFAVRTEVGVRLDVWQPYPGKYAKITANAQSVAQGEDTVLGLVVENLGVEPLEDETATVKVLSASGALQDVFTFPNINIAGNSNDKYVDTIRSSSYSPGKYTLAASLPYGSGVATMNSTFIVGTPDVDILGLEGPLYLDTPVNKFTVRVENLWNKPVDNVYARLSLGDQPSPTSSSSIAAFGITTLTGFWETDATTQPGEILANVTVHFPREDGTPGIRSELLPVVVYNETPKPPAPEEPSSSLPPIHIVFTGIAVLIVLCVVLFAVSALKKKDKKEDGEQQKPSSQDQLPPP